METNSIAQLVRHVTAVQAFLLTRALGEDVPHDHQYSLRNDPATRAELHATLDEANARKDDFLARIDGIDLSEVLPHPRLGQILRAWYVIHTADHGQEHLGHGELTAQLYADRHAAPSHGKGVTSNE